MHSNSKLPANNFCEKKYELYLSITFYFSQKIKMNLCFDISSFHRYEDW